VDFVPMNLLMPSCSAAVHHGGGGAFAAALEHGVPQLIVPSSFANLKWWGPIAQANSLEEYGAGCYVADSEHLTPQALREDLVRVLDDPSFARNAAGLAAALRTAPAPSDIVPTLEELTATHHGLTTAGKR
jgi:UDP:flavonoid glycosyltransferase YjiC (YdhE family)